MLRWYAPVLSFTTEEIYQLVLQDKFKSIHEQNFLKTPEVWKNNQLFERWNKLVDIRQKVNVSIEEKKVK